MTLLAMACDSPFGRSAEFDVEATGDASWVGRGEYDFDDDLDAQIDAAMDAWGIGDSDVVSAVFTKVELCTAHGDLAALGSIEARFGVWACPREACGANKQTVAQSPGFPVGTTRGALDLDEADITGDFVFDDVGKGLYGGIWLHAAAPAPEMEEEGESGVPRPVDLSLSLVLSVAARNVGCTGPCE